jgi:hypothetical protein
MMFWGEILLFIIVLPEKVDHCTIRRSQSGRHLVYTPRLSIHHRLLYLTYRQCVLSDIICCHQLLSSATPSPAAPHFFTS